VTYKVQLHHRAEKALDRLDHATAERILLRLRVLQNSPFVLGKGGGFENALQDSNLFHGARCAPYAGTRTSEDSVGCAPRTMIFRKS